MKLRTWLVQGRALLLAAVLAVGASNVLAQGTFTDKRDGKTYKTVEIGGKTWMAQNLNYQAGNSWCYGNDNSNCGKYGRLYDWKTARTACPSGWHLPSHQEWDNLSQAVGGVRGTDEEGNTYWTEAGKKLKSTSGWNKNGNGSDDFGFSALPGGYRSTGGSFGPPGISENWWSATAPTYGSGLAYRLHVGYDDDLVYQYDDNVSAGCSVHCVGD
jgi:uncharacterized protein (TIGR02145 family)